MIKLEAGSRIVVAALTPSMSRVEMRSTSRPDLSDKNGLATGRKNRREAVFAFTEF